MRLSNNNKNDVNRNLNNSHEFTKESIEMTNLKNDSVKNSNILINTETHKNGLQYKNGLRTSTHRDD